MELVLAARSAKQYEGHYLEIRYENLVNNTAEVLSTVFNFCDLPHTVEQLNTIVDAHHFEAMKQKGQTADPHVQMDKRHYRKGKIGSWREDLDPVQRFVLNRIAGDLLRELGYTSNNDWITLELLRYNLPVLFLKEFGYRPLAFLRAARRKVGGFYSANQ